VPVVGVQRLPVAGRFLPGTPSFFSGCLTKAEGDQVMTIEADRTLTAHEAPSGRLSETLVFLLLAVLIWPFIAVGVVAGWGFLVWMYYLFTGPPGPV
jgi:nitrate reductase NapE